jgi:hypothetical protein
VSLFVILQVVGMLRRPELLPEMRARNLRSDADRTRFLMISLVGQAVAVPVGYRIASALPSTESRFISTLALLVIVLFLFRH